MLGQTVSRDHQDISWCGPLTDMSCCCSISMIIARCVPPLRPFSKDSPYLEARTPLLCSRCNTTGTPDEKDCRKGLTSYAHSGVSNDSSTDSVGNLSLHRTRRSHRAVSNLNSRSAPSDIRNPSAKAVSQRTHSKGKSGSPSRSEINRSEPNWRLSMKSSIQGWTRRHAENWRMTGRMSLEAERRRRLWNGSIVRGRRIFGG